MAYVETASDEGNHTAQFLFAKYSQDEPLNILGNQ